MRKKVVSQIAPIQAHKVASNKMGVDLRSTKKRDALVSIDLEQKQREGAINKH
jgi:hypothetical protein